MTGAELDSGDPQQGRFITFRSVVVGALMSVLIGVHGSYWTIYLRSSRMYADYHTGGAAFWLFVLFVVFNLVLSRLWKRLAFSAQELMVITAMMFISGSIISSGLVAHFVPMISAVYYQANPANQWHETLWPNLKSWMAPLDPNGGTLAIKKFWEGLGAGEPIPWGPWVKPLLSWGVLLMALFGCMTAVMALMRKQWVDHEHLSFPIAQVPAALCSAAADPLGRSSIFRSRVFWIGLGLTFAMASLGGVSFYLTGEPWFFRIRESVTDLGPIPLPINVSLVVVGLVFLIPNRVAFSVGALCLASWVAKSVFTAYGLGMKDWMLYGAGAAEFQFSSMGAMLAFVLGSVWLGRRHLWRALVCALGLGERGYDADEPSSYRLILLVGLFCAVTVTVWLCVAGMEVLFAICLLLAFLVIYYGMARVVAQCGLPSASAPILPSTYLGQLFGGSVLGPRQSTIISSQIWHADMRNGALSGAAHGMYLVRRRRGGLLWALLLALVVTYLAGSFFTVRLGYRHAALNMDQWFFLTSPRMPWYWASSLIEQGAGFNWAGLTWTGVGAGIMGALMVAQRWFFWWPLHPVAFLICHSHMVQGFWFSIFLAWGGKTLLVSLGGYSAYRKGRRFCIGMVLGYFLAGGLWGIVDTITGAVGDSVFYI